MKVTLVVSRGSRQGKEIPVTRSPFLIGRDPECHLRPASQMISRRHCALVIRNERMFLRDFGSTNGTIVNGERVVDEQELHHGDQIQLDRLVFDLQIESRAADTIVGNGEYKGERDDEVVAALLLELQDDDRPGAPAPISSEAELSLDSTVLSVPAPTNPPAEPASKSEKKKPDQAAPGSTSDAAKKLLSQYKRKRRAEKS
jgi:predicted component of type VI protein secretion system